MLNILNKKTKFLSGNKLYLNNFDIKTKNGIIKDDKMFPWNIHYPPNTQEWSDSVYTYNKSYIKHIAGSGNTLNNIIASFFNMTFVHTKDIISARKRIEYKRKLINRIFVSKALVKHTNNKVVVTLFTYNRERLFLTEKIHDLYLELKERRDRLSSDYLGIHKHISKDIYEMYSDKHILKKKITKLIPRVLKNNSHINKKTNNEIKLLFTVSNKKSILKNINSFLILFNNLNDKYKQYNKLVFELQELYFYENKILLLNSYRYKDFFLLQIKSFISKIYNKNIEFKIINLKKLSLNSDIFTQAIVKKLKNRKNALLNVLNKSLSLVKPVAFNKYKILDYDLENKKKYKNSYLINKNKYKFNKFIGETFSYNNSTDISNKINENVMYNLKNKFIKGVKLQARGRLTTRLIASRSVDKFKYKGNLKNVDSSYKGLSAVILKGYTKSNIQYTLINSVRRNGSFGLKGWISSY